MSKYKCIPACGYVYDPEKGDPKHNINKGTPFEKLPEKWACPVCKGSKRMFRKVD